MCKCASANLVFRVCCLGSPAFEQVARVVRLCFLLLLFLLLLLLAHACFGGLALAIVVIGSAQPPLLLPDVVLLAPLTAVFVVVLPEPWPVAHPPFVGGRLRHNPFVKHLDVQVHDS